MSRKVLVTGASGFLGRHVLGALRADPAGPWEPLALVRDRMTWDGTRWQQELGPVPAVEGELVDTASWEAHPSLEGLGGIVHLAAMVQHSRKSPEEMVRTNIEGTLSMVRLAEKHRCRLVFVSTSGTVGCFRHPDESADESAPFCLETVKAWPYYRSKIEAEQAARALADALGVELVILRPPVILGPLDHRYRSTNHVARVLKGKVPFLLEGGMHFADVRDVASALVRTLAIAHPRPVYNLPGTQSSLADFFRMVAALAGVSLPKRKVPNRLVWVLAKLNQALGARALHVLPDPVVIEMAGHHWGLRSAHAATDLGYEPRPAAETIRDTIAWLSGD